MDYLEYTFSGFREGETIEILTALLDNAGYSGFLESGPEIIAYIAENLKDEKVLNRILQSVSIPGSQITYTLNHIPETNWNEKWEQDFQPVAVQSKVYIRAPFHPPPHRIDYDIIIEPKMSFGTGHHETTRLMIKAMLDIEFRDKRVLDMGCGTGVLGILASKMGAEEIFSVDIDDWPCRNTIENAAVNQCRNIIVAKGDVRIIGSKSFDIILANINRNVLLSDMSAYKLALNAGGILVISGILKKDREIINESANQTGFVLRREFEEKDWLSIVF